MEKPTPPAQPDPPVFPAQEHGTRYFNYDYEYGDLPYEHHSVFWDIIGALSPVLFIITIWMAVDAYKRYGGFNSWHLGFFFGMPIVTPVYFIIHAPVLFNRRDGSSFFAPSYKSRIAKVEQNLIVTDTIANRFALAELLYESKNIPRAEEEFRKILAWDNQHQEAQYFLGLCRLEQKDLVEARKFLEPILTKDRKYKLGVAMLHFTCLQWEEGQKAESLEERRKLTRSFPRPLFEYAYADALVQSGEKETAREVLNEMITTAHTAPKEDRVWIGKGKKLLKSL